MKKILINIIFFLILFAQSLSAQWIDLQSNGFNYYTQSGIANSICSGANGAIYVAGFQNSNGHFVMKRSNTEPWGPLGYINDNGLFRSICADKFGKVYAIWEPTQAGGNCYVAEWNGNTWSPLGGQYVGVEDICTDEIGNVYALSNSSVKKWNGTTNTWIDLGGLNGIGSTNDGQKSICADAMGNVYARGSLDSGFVAKWNGSTWSELGVIPRPNLNYLEIGAICCDELGNVYAAVSSYILSPMPIYQAHYIIKWNGTTWSTLGYQYYFSNKITSVCTDKFGGVYATNEENNYNNVCKFYGNHWGELGGMNSLNANGSINSICSDSIGNIYALGDSTNSSGNRYYYIAKYSSSDGVESTLSNNEILFNVSPNPCKNKIFITSKNNLETSVKIVDTQGRTVFPFQVFKSQKTIDVSILSSGLYILYLKQGNKAIKTKLVKE